MTEGLKQEIPLTKGAPGLSAGLEGTTNPLVTLEPKQSWLQSWLPFLRWSPTSPQQLAQAEEKLLKYVNTPSQGFYVNLGEVNGEECRVWTRRFVKEGSRGAPLVMVHGMGAGLAMFALNYDSIARSHEVYSLDLPGFGRSSRVPFPSDPIQIEDQYVDIIEMWRKKAGLGKMVLLGHSFGGHLTGLYCLKYPQNVEKAILADPWGMTPRPEQAANRRRLPLWVRLLAKVLANFNPLWTLRASGPLGPWLVARTRPDIMRKYECLVGPENTRLVSDYLFHCNTHNPTGESAFHGLMTGFGWATNPLLPRLQGLNPMVRLHVMYGAQSWMSQVTEEDFREAGVTGDVTVQYIQEAGHHIYADQHQTFNEAVNTFIDK